MNDEVAWRIHEFQLENDNPNHKEPDASRPPQGESYLAQRISPAD